MIEEILEQLRIAAGHRPFMPINQLIVEATTLKFPTRKTTKSVDRRSVTFILSNQDILASLIHFNKINRNT